MTRKRKQEPSSGAAGSAGGQKYDHKKPRKHEDKGDFYASLSNTIAIAWHKRKTEGSLYSVWTRISETMCKVVEPVDHPRTTLTTTPQYPIVADEGNENGQGEKKGKGKTKGKGKPNAELPWPHKIPDFTRTFDAVDESEDGGPEISQTLIDMVEIKSLSVNDDEPWGTEAARANAGERIPFHLFQVYLTTMAAFNSNPGWKHIYTDLVIGIYYTQLHWKRPNKEILGRVPVDFNAWKSVPNGRGGSLKASTDKLKAMLTEFEGRPMPEILCWNEPIVNFGDGGNVLDSYRDVTFTKQFLWSMRQPFKHHRGTKFERGWLSATHDRPREVDAKAITRGNAIVRRVLVGDPVIWITNHIDELNKFVTTTPISVGTISDREEFIKDPTYGKTPGKRRYKNQDPPRAPLPHPMGTRLQLRKLLQVEASMSPSDEVPGTVLTYGEAVASQTAMEAPQTAGEVPPTEAETLEDEGTDGPEEVGSLSMFGSMHSIPDDDEDHTASTSSDDSDDWYAEEHPEAEAKFFT